ncbi:hypothetical protein [Dankookia sp. P2]|uniref:hypothetical protein n=1 Tax=Dankookia sp. P2 TaxID=3423955 RepID=UPI003D66AFC0
MVVVPAPPGGVGSAALGHRILRALLAAEAAVVELDTIAAWAAVPALSPYPALDAADQPAALRAALLALRAELGAGLLVAVGLGEAGDLALLAIADPVAPPLAAAVALGEAPRFLPGPPPPAAEAVAAAGRAALRRAGRGAGARRPGRRAAGLPVGAAPLIPAADA